MAKIHVDRLKRRYKDGDVRGAKYSELVKEIMDNNIENVQRNMYVYNKNKWKTFDKKFSAGKETKLVIPNEEDVIPKRALHILKAAESGKLIADKLRDQLTKNLRDSLFNFKEESYITRRGEKAGRINPRLIENFEKDIRGTFQNYTKKGKGLTMPSNVHSIAVTEMRSAVNNIKKEFTQKLIDDNPDIIVSKKWVHNRRLSKVPRRGHVQMERRKAIPFNNYFEVPLYKEQKGRLVKVGVTMMRHPHDPSAPIEQKINCNCDYDIIVTRKK